jgi:hypothetical protein
MANTMGTKAGIAGNIIAGIMMIRYNALETKQLPEGGFFVYNRI